MEVLDEDLRESLQIILCGKQQHTESSANPIIRKKVTVKKKHPNMSME